MYPLCSVIARSAPDECAPFALYALIYPSVIRDTGEPRLMDRKDGSTIMGAIKWSYKADMINACICDWGCPCNFNAKPTNGLCEGLYTASIKTGRCGDIKLDGLKYAWAAKWPGAIHEGGGTAKIWIDENASKEQNSALGQILQGRLKGVPWGILGPTVDNWLESSVVPFEWKFDGSRSFVKAGGEVQASLDAMRNPVTGAETSAKIFLPNGMVTKELEVTSTRSFSVFTKGLKFAAPGKYGFYATVEHGT